MKPRFYGHWSAEGKLQAASFWSALNGFRSRSVPVILTVEEDKGKRSNQANRYYRGVVVYLIAEALRDAGWEPAECSHEAVHEMLKYRFLKVDKPIGNDGEFVTRVKSTTELDKEEFGAYIEHCVRFAAEYLNVVIPPPMEQTKLDIAA